MNTVGEYRCFPLDSSYLNRVPSRGRGAGVNLKAAGNEAIVGRNLEKGKRSRRFPRSRRLRFAIAVVLALLAGVAYYIGENVKLEQDVELAVSADQGEATVAIAARKFGVSPGCGCQNPEGGDLDWTGLALPSESFQLGVTAAAADNVAQGVWQLTAMAPDADHIDWYAAPYATLEMRVTVDRGGRNLRLFEDHTTFLQLIGTRPIGVEQDPRFPYAALLPAAGGETTAISRAPVRPGAGGSLDVASSAPSREWVTFPRNGYRSDLSNDVTQRGPMIDVIGPTTFRIERAGGFQIYAGKQLIRGIRPSDEVTVRLRTPYSLRLFPSPAPRPWVKAQPTVWREELTKSEKAAEVRREERRGPALTGRNIIDYPLPSFTVHLADLSVPDERIWSSFATRSAEKVTIHRMIAASPHDALVHETFGLPPVSARPEVGVFGKVTHYKSDAVRGELVVGSDSSRISDGEKVSMDSSSGLDAGKYRSTPLISAGVPTEEATVAGKGEVAIDGDPRTTLEWLRGVAAAIAAAVIGLAIHALGSWVHRGHPTDSHSF